MASIWKQNKDVTQQVKRNNHDLSFDNHCTMKLGYLYPVFKKFVVPGDSFRIRSAFDLKLMPLVFPLQSRMRAHLHFFYVRCKNVWPEIEDYLTGIPRSSPIVEPYLTPADNKVTTGSIYDFLGVPTTLVSKVPVSFIYDTLNYDFSGTGEFGALYLTTVGSEVSLSRTFTEGSLCSYFIKISKKIDSNTFALPSSNEVATFIKDLISSGSNMKYIYFDGSKYYTIDSRYSVSVSEDGKSIIFTADSGDFVDSVNNLLDTYSSVIIRAGYSEEESSLLPFMPITEDVVCVSQNKVPKAGFYEYKDLNLNLYRDHLHLKAMPFRAYESIYRAYYANDILQPLIDSNGDAQYNKFCTTTASGQDTTDYHLFKRNYELDFLTSAYPSPQAGPAPLVGISALGNITIEDENGITTAKAVVDESTGQITGVSITSPLASVDHGRTLVNISQAGISINDFRNANALQRFLEQTLRSGYRYIDFIRGQWGVKPKDQALDMPEFIGGFSRDVALQTVTSVADMATGAPDEALSKQLGGFAGVGRVLGGSEHAISKFCDDYGYIIGVMSVTPTPAYSQLLDKQMIAGDNYLSFPFAAFNQLGMQPIPYKEVTPIQAYLDSIEDPTKSLNDTFGYQRPNYDLVGSVDEVHGEFRSTLKDFLINRIFDGRPELGSSFIEIDPSEVNDVFVNQSPDDDVLIGHIRFKVDTKRPFPRIHFPSL